MKTFSDVMLTNSISTIPFLPLLPSPSPLPPPLPLIPPSTYPVSFNTPFFPLKKEKKENNWTQ